MSQRLDPHRTRHGMGTASGLPTAGDIGSLESWLLEWVAGATGRTPGAVRADGRFSSYGLDSMALTRLVAEASRLLGRPLAPTLAWSCPTPAALARHLAGGRGELAAGAARGAAERGPAAVDEPIAVVGMAARFPGAPSVAAYWDLLAAGRDAVVETPRERWAVDDWYGPGEPGRMATRWGGFLEGIADFDPLFFGISPAEAVQMDPQQRLVMELAWEALEDAGTVPESLRGRAAGVFVGAMWSEYGALTAADPTRLTTHSATGGDTSIISARVSYTLGLTGPSLTVNTACSSSLVALHQARRSLLSGECELALAGGVNLLCDPAGTVAMSHFGAMAPDGRCKVFDARANGYVRGEGGGLVVLKPLSRARADGDRIYCTLRGSAVNNDGFSNGLTAPSPQAQEAVLRRACADAGVVPAAVRYVETHGTGTMLGDPIEAGALGAVYGEGRRADAPLLLGAVKSNIGHLEAAAGVAGFVKTALVLHHRTVPRNLHFESPNPHIPLDDLRLEVPTAARPWPGGPDEAAWAGVSGFGFGGTNCHVLLSGAPREDAAEDVVDAGRPAVPEAAGGAPAGPVFVFGGQGSQWPRMAVELMTDPAFARAVRACDRALAPHLGGRSVKDLLTLRREPLDDTGSVQAAVFTVQVALAALWAARGVRPAAVIGQSMGEIAAAHVSGALGLDDAARLVAVRARLVDELAGDGTMAVVGLDAERTRAALARHGDPDLAVAVLSGPDRTVISGGRAAVDGLLAVLAAEDVTVRPIDVDYASHSAHMDPLLTPLRKALAGLAPGPSVVPMWSTVTGAPVAGEELDADYWCRNLREPVLFGDGIAGLAAQGHRHFLDLNPHPVTLLDTERVLDGRGQALPSMRRGEPARPVLAASARALGPAPDRPDVPHLLTLSARDEQALAQAAKLTAGRLAEAAPGELPGICHTLAAHRGHHEHRLALVTSDARQAAGSLAAYARGERPPGLVRGRARAATTRTVFVFPGQGGQHATMGRTLYAQEPAFRRAAHTCAELIHAEGGIDLLPWLRGEQPLDTEAIAVVQPAVFTVSVALDALWRSWGVEPAAVVGHSMGEAAAAYACGALSLPDAVRVICRRSAALGPLTGRGAMLLVDLGPEAALAAAAPYAPSAELAAANGPRATVLTGDADEIAEAALKFDAQGVMARVLQVGVAAHSRQCEPLLPGLRRALKSLTPGAERVPFVSTVTGRVHPGEALDAGYWARNLREPVRFADAVGRIAADGPACFLELGPHPVLVPALQDLLRGQESAAVGALRRDRPHRETLALALAGLHTGGVALDWDRTPLPAGRLTALPAYPWQRRRYWITDPPRHTDEPVDRAPLADRIAAASPDKAADLVRHHLTAHLTALLEMDATELPADVPLLALGAGSLVAMQLRNTLLEDLNADLKVSRILNAPSLTALAQEALDAGTGAVRHVQDAPTEVLL
ncbi:type I polyketide synthase [Streptomyces pinistramenti]|uniref:type I polyketide synthase n=1 Tax=Streptomyces pinistramenti TaxID=2884812 RepID=UPI001D062679|nr:type I polyketide synthase [Streptomyces pinistramenti]MCB5906943.1 acyltransferase domain-containing protein [Streptomyces pinistramenti]